MKVVTIRRCPGELQRILKAARRRDVILCPPQGGEILVSFIDDFDYELAAQRRNPKLMGFLDRQLRQARKEKGVALDEVRRKLGLSSRLNGKPSADADINIRTITVSARSRAILKMLQEASREWTVLKIANGGEYVLLAIREGDYELAELERPEAVMTYLDGLDHEELPRLEVAFRKEPPRRSLVRAKQSSSRKVR